MSDGEDTPDAPVKADRPEHLHALLGLRAVVGLPVSAGVPALVHLPHGPQAMSAGMVERVAAKLSPLQASVLTRGMVRIGNPEQLVPRHYPELPRRTWQAVERKGLIAQCRFGYALTDLGRKVRAALQETENAR